MCMYEGIDMGQQRGKKRCMCLHVSIPAVAPVFLSRGEWGLRGCLGCFAFLNVYQDPPSICIQLQGCIPIASG